LAFTATAIGFAVWYRWPYTEVTLQYHMIRMPDGTHVADKTRPPWGRVETTWRRNWGGWRTKYGPRTDYDHKGSAQEVIEFFEKQPIEVHDTVTRVPPLIPGEIRDSPMVTGRYLNGRREGTWIWENEGKYRVTQTFRDGLVDGECEILRAGKEPFHITFVRGRVIEANGQKVSSPLLEDLAQNAIAPTVRAELERPRDESFLGVPLDDAMDMLDQDLTALHVIIDSRYCNPKLEVRQSFAGIDLASAITFLTKPYGLDCDYRYGCLWFTSADQAKVNPTFQLDQRLKEGLLDSPAVQATLAGDVQMEFLETPLTDAVQILKDSYSVPLRIDHTANPDLPLTLNLHDLPFQSALYALCELHDLDCDYRYGCLWIAARDDEVRWSDPTGVLSLVPPASSKLAQVWNQTVPEVYADDEPLVSVIGKLAAEIGVEIDRTRIDDPDSYPVSPRLKNLPFRHVLGVLLYESGCRCALDGPRLVLLPPQDHAANSP